jgi:hypothetical protein
MVAPSWDIQSSSEEWLVQSCGWAEKDNDRISTHNYADRVIKLSDNIAVKYGHGVKVAETRTQEFA